MPASKSVVPVAKASDVEILRKLKRYLLLREEGLLFYEACKAVELPPRTVVEWRRNNPQFADAERMAKAEGVEIVERKLAEKARDGDMQAITKFLEANDPEVYGKQTQDGGHVVVVLDAGNHLDRIRTLKEDLERRRRDTPLAAQQGNDFFNAPPPTVHETDDEVYDAEVVE